MILNYIRSGQFIFVAAVADFTSYALNISSSSYIPLLYVNALICFMQN